MQISVGKIVRKSRLRVSLNSSQIIFGAGVRLLRFLLEGRIEKPVESFAKNYRKELSGKTQYLFFLEGRFGEDTHSACRYLRARTQYLLFLEGRFGEDMAPVLMRCEDTITSRFGRTIR